MNDLFDIERFMPHGHCYLWDPGILWTGVISDALIAGAYIAIPFTLIFQIMRKRKDLPFDWMFVCFGLFIVACGFSHVMDIVTVWKPYYPILAIVKAITAAASVPTAIILFRIAPKIVKLPTLQQLVDEQTRRTQAEAASEAKDRFIAVLSHELRTPLTPVKAGLELLESELDPASGYTASPAARAALKMIRQNVEIETSLINDLLDVSSTGHGKLNLQLRRVDLEEVLNRSLSLVQDELRRKHIALDVQHRTHRTKVMGAPARLQQIVHNLLTNAIKSTPENGQITVELRHVDEQLKLSVHDTGGGIASEDLGKIFQPFEQCNRQQEKARGGLGLGLTIAKTLAESHHGRLIAESAGIGRGATFTLELPVADEETQQVALPPEKSAARDETKPLILLVDDHADTLRTIASLLRRAGYRVETAATIEEAEALLPVGEILVSDIGLPDGNGWDLMMRFKEQRGGPGIAISGFGQEEDIQKSRRAGFSQHLIKPIDIDALKAALQTLQPA